MSWKCEIQLKDLDPNTEFEVMCKRCGLGRYETPRDLIQKARLGHLFIDELEQALYCRDRRCQGAVRISVVHDGLNQAFVGGMA